MNNTKSAVVTFRMNVTAKKTLDRMAEAKSLTLSTMLKEFTHKLVEEFEKTEKAE